MANTEYKRVITKHGNGMATVPPSPSHDTGDWIATDIYEGELYIDDVTGFLYTNVAGVIVQLDSGAIPPASETEAGIAEIATQLETNTGTDDGRIVTPKKLAGWWTNLKLLVAQILTESWTFEKLYVQASGAIFKTRIASGASSNQTWTVPGEGDQTFASQEYADTLVASAVAGLMDYRGVFDASVNNYPSSGGSGVAGAILQSDFWVVSVAGTPSAGVIVEPGDLILSKVDSPSVATDWDVIQYNIGYTPENAANKTDTVSGNEASSTKYLSVKGSYDYLLQGLTQALATKATPIDADSVLIEDSADSNKTKKTTWANIKATLKTYFDTLYLTLSSVLTGIDITLTGTVSATDTVLQAFGRLQKQASDAVTSLAMKEASANKDASGGYVGLSTWKINFRNAANTFTSFLVNAATAVRTYTFPDKDITVAGIDDVTNEVKLEFTNTNPADATTYYFGIAPSGVTTVDGDRNWVVRGDWTITHISVYLYVNTVLGSAGSTTWNLRINVADTLITNTLAATAGYQAFHSGAVSINISDGDAIQGKLATPTWATNPTGCVAAVILTRKRR